MGRLIERRAGGLTRSDLPRSSAAEALKPGSQAPTRRDLKKSENTIQA
jgi:hypothetical protein